jgi:methionyl-tRNA formyltransferase
MNITILNTSENHPVNSWLKIWIENYKNDPEIHLFRSKKELVGGDILFLISCSEIISEDERSKFNKTLIIHASDLPKGRGWSPHIWEIVNGAKEITLSLLEAENKVDSGDLWKKIQVQIPQTALYKEINELIFKAELELMDYAVKNFYKVTPTKQSFEESSYWPKRTPKDSGIDIDKSISEQFDLIRVCDPNRFPAFFYKDGRKFILKVEVADE